MGEIDGRVLERDLALGLHDDSQWAEGHATVDGPTYADPSEVLWAPWWEDDYVSQSTVTVIDGRFVKVPLGFACTKVTAETVDGNELTGFRRNH